MPEFASSVVFPRLFGRQRAFAILALGAEASAEACEAAGLYTAVLPGLTSDQLLEKVRVGAVGLHEGLYHA